MPSPEAEIEHVHHMAAKHAVDQIACNPCIQQTGNDHTRPENLLVLPHENRQDGKRENRKRPNLALHHPPRTPAVFNVCKRKETIYHLDRRRILEIRHREFLDYLIGKGKIERDYQRRENALDQILFFSIAF